MHGHVIPRNGDIVVGQEYTDFDKGLEEGIEGAVLGFNLLLVSAFGSDTRPELNFPESIEYGAKLVPEVLRRSFVIEPHPVRRQAAHGAVGGKKPEGQQLVEITYNNCEIGRGSPFIGGTKMIISWTRTPVRVFGGALIKNVQNNCGVFSTKF